MQNVWNGIYGRKKQEALRKYFFRNIIQAMKLNMMVATMIKNHFKMTNSNTLRPLSAEISNSTIILTINEAVTFIPFKNKNFTVYSDGKEIRTGKISQAGETLVYNLCNPKYFDSMTKKQQELSGDCIHAPNYHIKNQYFSLRPWPTKHISIKLHPKDVRKLINQSSNIQLSYTDPPGDQRTGVIEKQGNGGAYSYDELKSFKGFEVQRKKKTKITTKRIPAYEKETNGALETTAVDSITGSIEKKFQYKGSFSESNDNPSQHQRADIFELVNTRIDTISSFKPTIKISRRLKNYFVKIILNDYYEYGFFDDEYIKQITKEKIANNIKTSFEQEKANLMGNYFQSGGIVNGNEYSGPYFPDKVIEPMIVINPGVSQSFSLRLEKNDSSMENINYKFKMDAFNTSLQQTLPDDIFGQVP